MPSIFSTKQFYTEQKQPLLCIALGIALLVISIFFDSIATATMKSIENPYLTYFFTTVSNTFLLVFLLGIVLVVLLYLAKKQQQIGRLLLIFLLILIITAALKVIVARTRPLDGAVEISFFDYSFPSQHTAFTVATVFYIWQKLSSKAIVKYFYLALAIVVAMSRIYLQAHYLSDIIAGALVGYIIAWWVVECESHKKATSY